MQIGGLFIIINYWHLKSWIPIVVRDGMQIEFYKCNFKKLFTIIKKKVTMLVMKSMHHLIRCCINIVLIF
jgi:hypothetical protein